MHATGREIAALFETQTTQARQFNGFLVHMDCTGQPETQEATALAFKLGKPECAFPLPFLVEADPAEEISVRLIQITQGLLRGCLADFVHPWDLGFFELVDFPIHLASPTPTLLPLIHPPL